MFAILADRDIQIPSEFFLFLKFVIMCSDWNTNISWTNESIISHLSIFLPFLGKFSYGVRIICLGWYAVPAVGRGIFGSGSGFRGGRRAVGGV